MATRTVVCPECADPVPYGRLSCPTCGAMIASVAGEATREASGAPSSPAPGRGAASPSRSAARPASSSGRVTNQGLRPGSPPPRGESVAAPQVEAALPSATPVPAGVRTPPRRRVSTRADDGALPATGPAWPVREAAPGHGGPNGASASAASSTNGSLVPHRDSNSRQAAPAPRVGSHPGAPAGSQPGLPFAAATSAVAADGPPEPTWPPQPAGAYLPPSAVFAPRAPLAPIGGALRARRATAGTDVAFDDPGTSWPGAPSAANGAGIPEPAPAVAAAEASLLADLPFDIPATVADWLVAAGSGVAAIGFLLPWSANVIGAKGIGTYLDAWGLASPSNFIVLLLAIGTLALTIIPNRVPMWLRTGTFGLLLGGVLLGLVWPYLVGGWAGGAQIGVLGETVAAFLLIVGGILVQRPDRHARDATGV